MPTPPVPDWDNDKILKFLELYETERAIWDPRHKNHKYKHKVHDAWNRISVSLDNTPIEELKAKKKSLMASFRPLLKKKQNSIRSGAGTDDVFQPVWFAFEIMERFLGTIYDVEETINTESSGNLNNEYELTQSLDVEAPLPSPSQPIPSSSQSVPSTSQPVPSTSQPVPPPPANTTRANKAKRRGSNNAIADEAQNKISQTLDTLNQVLKDKRNTTTIDEDECEIYAKLLAKRLRKYPESMRARIMYQIDGFLLQNPYPVDRPLSASSRHSSSAQSQYSDYQISTPSPGHIIPHTQQQYSDYQISTPSPVHVIPHTQQQYSDYQISTPSPVHIIPHTQQPQQHVYIMQPTVSESPVQLRIPEMNENLTPPTHAFQQTSQSQHNVIQPSESSIQPSIQESNVTVQTQMNMIERAYWNATQEM